jgi:hypothetical protein
MLIYLGNACIILAMLVYLGSAPGRTIFFDNENDVRGCRVSPSGTSGMLTQGFTLKASVGTGETR